MPPALLQQSVGEMDFDEFFRNLARARYIQELEEDIVARAIVKVLGE